jgi:predicted nucleic acid-binding protein
MKDADTEILRWIENRTLGELYLTSTVVYEIARGVERLPAGRKRRALEAVFEGEFLPLFAGRILPLDTEAARVWARLAGEGERRGRLPPTLDCQIAAVAIRHGMTVVTVDQRGFEPLGCELVDPTA